MRMKKQQDPWQIIPERELAHIDGGGWFDDFKRGFKEGFDWAAGVIKDLTQLLK